MHAYPDFYKRGAWFDAVKAQHTVPSRGPGRRREQERSRVDKSDRPLAPDDPAAVEVVDDVAMIQGCYFCCIPSGRCEGQWLPMLHAQWMSYCDPIPGIRVPGGEHAALARGAANLLHLGVECFEVDTHEVPLFLHLDQVSALVYYAPGFKSIRAGVPDFYWVDTLWDKL